MRSVRSLMGLAVVRNGRRMGRVNGVKLSDGMDEMLGVWVDAGLSGRFLPTKEIELLGNVSILAKSKGKREKCDAKPMLARAVSADGQRLGAITDAFVDDETMKVLEVELSCGLMDDLLYGRLRIPQFSVRPDGEVVVNAPLEGGDEP